MNMLEFPRNIDAMISMDYVYKYSDVSDIECNATWSDYCKNIY